MTRQHTGGDPDYCPACHETPPAFPQCPGPQPQEDTVTPAAELRTAAQQLLDLADAADDDMRTNTYWGNGEPADVWRRGITNAVADNEVGQLAALLHPAAARTLAEWLRSAAVDAEQIGADHRAVAFARAINQQPATR